MTRRYLFLFYSDIEQVNLELLYQISDRIFLLMSDEVETIPVYLVQQLQKFGKGIKWVTMDSNDPEEKRMHLSFLLGKLHEKVPTDVEFAILGNDEDYDAMISFVNRSRRKCVRVCISEDKSGQVAPTTTPIKATADEKLMQALAFEPNGTGKQANANAHDNQSSSPTYAHLMEKPSLDEGVYIAASKVRERMMRSGNRPAELDLLKEYIILSTPNLQPGTAEKVIDVLAINKDIEVENREVLYHF